jgi:hypothetical protein
MLGKSLLFFGFLFFALSLNSPSYAQSKKETAKKTEKTAKKGEKVFDFEGDVIEAQFLKPDQSMTEVIARKKKSLLIQIRTDFIDEILRTVEDL